MRTTTALPLLAEGGRTRRLAGDDHLQSAALIEAADRVRFR